MVNFAFGFVTCAALGFVLHLTVVRTAIKSFEVRVIALESKIRAKLS